VTRSRFWSIDMARIPLLGVLLAGVLLAACERNIPEPPAEVDPDGGGVTPNDLPVVDAAPDQAPDLPPPVTCGTAGQECCAGNVCANGGCCQGGRCAANGTLCRADGTCLNGSCGGCGGLGADGGTGGGEICCEQRACTASRAVCVGEALPGQCKPCGVAGQPCCGDSFCDPGLSCDRAQVAAGVCVTRP
jgi:hypothetical protein